MQDHKCAEPVYAGRQTLLLAHLLDAYPTVLCILLEANLAERGRARGADVVLTNNIMHAVDAFIPLGQGVEVEEGAG